MAALTLRSSGAGSKVLNLPKELTRGCPILPDTGFNFSGQFSCLVCNTPSTGQRFFLVLKLLIQFAWGYYFLRNFQKHLKFNCSHSLVRESLGEEFSPLPRFYRIWHHSGWRETLGRRARSHSVGGRAFTLGLCPPAAVWRLLGGFHLLAVLSMACLASPSRS